jgi:peptidoglycan/LPS O-acetylase OafA/YrhL
MRENLPQLTGLRFFAAFYVFVFHADIRKSLDFLPDFGLNIVSQGAIGVNIFFILSGFILYYNYVNRKMDYKDFLYKRLAKIYPVYLFGFLLCWGVYQYLNIPLEHYGFIKILNLFLLQSYLPNYAMSWYGAGSWSISTEFFFYLLFPFLLIIVNKLNKQKIVIVIAITYVASFALGILHNLHWVELKWIYAFPPARISEFFIGMMVAALVFQFKIKITNRWIMIVVAACILYYILLGKNLQGYVIHNCIVIPLMFVFLVGVTTFKKNMFSFLGSKPIEYLGKISYSFYITQIPIMLFLDEKFIFKNMSSFSYFIVIFVINLILSIFAYHIIEKPLHQYFNLIIKKDKLRNQVSDC